MAKNTNLPENEKKEFKDEEFIINMVKNSVKNIPEEIINNASTLLKTKNIKQLEQLVKELGFGNKINPLQLKGAEHYKNNHRLHYREETDKELNRKRLFYRDINHDKTDYLAPYENGFIRMDRENYIAAYGIIKKTFVFKEILRDKSPFTPHHFFFISKLPDEWYIKNMFSHKERFEKVIDIYDPLLIMLVEMARLSPGNPANRINYFLEQIGIKKYHEENGLDTKMSDFVYGVNGFRKFFSEMESGIKKMPFN